LSISTSVTKTTYAAISTRVSLHIKLVTYD
jgi:hypothetical protein